MQGNSKALVEPGSGRYKACAMLAVPLLALSSATASASTGAPQLHATRVTDAPVIDGVLDDAAWSAATPSDAFTQKFPAEARPPTEKTTMRVVYDDDAIYVGFDCTQESAEVVARLTRRDRIVESDSVTFTVDTRRDGRSAFEFYVNAAGVLADAVRFNDTEFSSDWDDNWEAKTARTERGWSAELRIPLRILRFESLPVQTWGLQARRYVSARQETDEWAFIPRSAAGEVSHYGELGDLAALAPKNAIEVRPFVAARLRHRDPSADVVGRGTDFDGSVGFDLKWHVDHQLTLDATVNPDFAQVEADQVVLNISSYELYRPEKRPFFLEGLDTFSTPAQVLYTRRIGRAPDSPALRSGAPFGEQLLDLPQPATIYFAEKLVGQIAKGWTIGTLSALTQRSSVSVRLADGSTVRRGIEPLTLFQVFRVKRDLGDNAYVGAIATTTTRAESTADYPAASSPLDPMHLCPSGDVLGSAARCFHDAYVAGVDWKLRTRGGDYVTGGQLLASAIERGPARAIADGTTIRSGDVGAGAVFYAAKEGGKHWVWDATYDFASRKLDFNDLGYLRRQNQHHLAGGLEYRTLEPAGPSLETHTRLEAFERENVARLVLARGVQVSTKIKFRNFWEIWTQAYYYPARFDDREVGDGTALQRAGLVGHEFAASSDPRKSIVFWTWVQNQFLFDGHNVALEAGLTFRVMPQLDIELLPVLGFTYGEPRYASSGARPGQYVFGVLHARSLGATLRTTYTFTPRLTLQTYAQLFLASAHYQEFQSFDANPNGAHAAVRLSDLRASAPPSGNPDFEEGALNVNVVLRWEYTLGSTLFLVYSRTQSPKLQLLPTEIGTLDLGAVRRAPAVDVLLAKLSYWWG